jgi:hypothetical protein
MELFMRNRIIHKILFSAAVCFSLCYILPTAFCEESWRLDFDAVCAQSNEAMSFPVSELKTLIEKCDRLQKVIQAQEETVRKVYLKRLQLCKNLYVFVLEAKTQEEKAK